jgi:hypothetical protein
MKKKTITICASAAHFRKVVEIQKELKKLGFVVKIPLTASKMKRNNNYDVSFYKTWFNNKNDYKKKTLLVKDHFKKILEADAILVINLEKNGIEGYIGGNTLMELALAFHYKKPIFILNDISEKLSIAEEIYALQSKFIKGDLKNIKIK